MCNNCVQPCFLTLLQLGIIHDRKSCSRCDVLVDRTLPISFDSYCGTFIRVLHSDTCCRISFNTAKLKRTCVNSAKGTYGRGAGEEPKNITLDS